MKTGEWILVIICIMVLAGCLLALPDAINKQLAFQDLTYNKTR